MRGDVAAQWRPSLGRRARVEHWTSAVGQGAAVAHAIAGADRPYDDVPYFWSDQFGLRLQHVGHAGAGTPWRSMASRIASPPATSIANDVCSPRSSSTARERSLPWRELAGSA